MQKNFQASNPNFWARLVIFALSILGLIGVQFQTAPDVLGGQIVTTISTSGYYAVLGLIAVSVLMPIYNLVKQKPKITFASVFGSPNFWIYLLTFLFGIGMIYGIEFPDGTAEEIVGAIFSKDWSHLVNIAFVNILDPLIRWFRDKRQTPEVTQG